MDLNERPGSLSTFKVYAVGSMPMTAGRKLEHDYLTTKWTLRFRRLHSLVCSKHSGRSFP